MIPVFYKVLTIASCGSIVFMGLFMAINKMGPNTSHIVRMAWILITCGAFGVSLKQMAGDVPLPSAAQTMDWIGTAMFLAFDRRNYFIPSKYPHSVKAPDRAN